MLADSYDRSLPNNGRFHRQVQDWCLLGRHRSERVPVVVDGAIKMAPQSHDAELPVSKAPGATSIVAPVFFCLKICSSGWMKLEPVLRSNNQNLRL